MEQMGGLVEHPGIIIILDNRGKLWLKIILTIWMLIGIGIWIIFQGEPNIWLITIIFLDPSAIYLFCFTKVD